MAEDDTGQPPRKEPDEGLMKALDSLRGLLDANREASGGRRSREQADKPAQGRPGILPDIPVLREVVDPQSLAHEPVPRDTPPQAATPDRDAAEPAPPGPVLPPELVERLEGEIDAAVATAAAQLAEDLKRRLRDALDAGRNAGDE